MVGLVEGRWVVVFIPFPQPPPPPLRSLKSPEFWAELGPAKFSVLSEGQRAEEVREGSGASLPRASGFSEPRVRTCRPR